MTSAPAAPDIVLGPLARYADRTTATIWVETSAPCEVEIRGASGTAVRAQGYTFDVEGHHYAYLAAEGLEPGHDEPYTVLLDGVPAWPRPDDPRPAPRLRTLPADDELEIVFGSCRTDRPHELPWILERDEHLEGVGPDALHALALACQAGERPLPDLLLLLGDQVYADEGLSPRVRHRQIARRGKDSEPVSEVADFEEYTWLYRDSWSDSEVRWLLSTVPTAMIFDDHDVRDDWNTSAAWRADMRRKPWWRARVVGAYMSYWIYQHLGNLSPAEVEKEGVLGRIREAGGAELRRHAEQADDEAGGGRLVKWSYTRDLGLARLVVVDTRSGRVLDEDVERAMLRDDEWDLIEGQLCGDRAHLLVASSLPLVLERSLHEVERWNAATAAGAWGRLFRPVAERLRQKLDLEHWAAFPDSFRRLTRRLGEVAAGEWGEPPSTVVVLSGDVHHSYVASLDFPSVPGVQSRVVQVVSSPLRNGVKSSMQRGLRMAASPVATAAGRALAVAARLPAPEVRWSIDSGPSTGNGLGVLRLDGRRADLTFYRAVLERVDAKLIEAHSERLDAEDERSDRRR